MIVDDGRRKRKAPNPVPTFRLIINTEEIK
jgi:hypothetical protein